MKGFIKTEQFIKEWESMEGENCGFNSLYEFALYTCGGDFSSFDDILLLQEEINK